MSVTTLVAHLKLQMEESTLTRCPVILQIQDSPLPPCVIHHHHVTTKNENSLNTLQKKKKKKAAIFVKRTKTADVVL